MPISGISNPSSDYTGPYSAVRSPILDGYIFNAGLNYPQVSSFVTEKFKKKFKLTTLLDRLGAYQATPNDTFSWFIQDRQRQSATISSGVTGLPTTSLTLTLDTVAAGANLGYFVVGDLVRTEAGTILRVNSVGDAGGFQTITVGRPDGGNITSGMLDNTEKIGHISTSFEEGSTGPNGRLYLPDEEYNYTQIFRAGTKVTGSALTQKTWVLDGKAWYWKNEDYMFEEFAYDQELNLMFGVRSVSGTRKTTRGLWDRIVTNGEGQNQTFASGTGITETDLQAVITKLNRQAGSDELIAFCGSEAISDIEVALKHYYVNGGVDYGSLGANTVGLDTRTYKFGGKTIHFMHYPLFDDDKALPFTSTPTASKVNFRHVALLLDLGDTENGEPHIKLRYKEHDGEQRKFIHKVIPGMHGTGDDNGGIAANSFDGFEVQVLAECGVEFKNAQLSAALYPNS